MNTPYEQLRRDSFDWILDAAEIALAKFGEVSASLKADRSIVTEADFAVQASLLDSIAARYPNDAVIAEETQADAIAHADVATAKRCWAVDPIDGTRNYARGMPVFTLSVALLEEGDPVVGWIYDPNARRMYSASRGGGVWIDDQRITPSPAKNPGQPFISIPTNSDEELPRVAHEWIDRMVVRNFGSTALHLAMLAIGAIDAVYARRPKLWDIAAGAVLAGEVGARTVSTSGEPYFPMNLADYKNTSLPFITACEPLLGRLVADVRESPDPT